MEEKKNILTKTGRDQLEEELRFLKEVRRPEVIEKIKEARAQGDLSENAEYDAAKNEQGEVETRIAEIEEILKHSEVAEEAANSKVVYVGAFVTIADPETKEEETYQIVGTNEVDSMENKISVESPIGKAVIGHKTGETVTVVAPACTYEIKIKKISKK